MRHKKILEYLIEKHYVDHISFIGVGIVSSVICCVYAILFSKVEELSLHFLRNNPYLAFLVAPLFLCISWLLVQKIAPAASGSGIPQVMLCIESSHKHLTSVFLNFKVLLVKIASSLMAIFSGAAIGREGPSLQISAVVGHYAYVFSERLGINIKKDQLLIAGAASGLAAAFNTPIGGIVYAIEELSHEHLRKFKDVLLLSVVIAGFTAQTILGNYLYLGFPVVKTSGFTAVLIISIVSLLCGILGCVFSMLLIRMIQWRITLKFKQQLLLVAGVGVILVGAFLFVGERAIFSGKESINYVLFSKTPLSALEVFFRFFSPLISSFTGIAGGIFAPSLSAGATLGALASEYIDPELRTILGLAGMISFLTGVTRTPITAFVLVLEMTDRHSAVFSMMFASLFGSLGAHFLCKKSFYEASVDMMKQNLSPKE